MLTAKRLRDREFQARTEAAKRGPVQPATISRVEHDKIVQELVVHYEAELSKLRARLGEGEPEAADSTVADDAPSDPEDVDDSSDDGSDDRQGETQGKRRRRKSRRSGRS
ncbi:MAG: hypothetical protein GVY18_09090 [Bacteroidetes bacterium]|jgi:hypothetical protein|nr:hypothetical protein [Bacteroidota bacterium]